MKKLLVLILALCMLLTLAACGSTPEEPSPSPDDVPEASSDTPQTPKVTCESYTYTFAGMMGEETAQIDLYTDGTCQFYLPGNPMIVDVYAGTYTREGDTVTILGFTNVDASSEFVKPGLWDWIDSATGDTVVTVNADGTFVPAAAEVPAVDVSGTYTYTYEGLMGEETAQLVLNTDGTCEFCLPDHMMIKDVYAGTYTAAGTTVSIVGFTNVDASSEYAKPGLWDWIDSATGDAVVTIDVEAKTFAPGAAEGGNGGPMGPMDGPDGGEPTDAETVSYASNSDAQVCDIYVPEGADKAPVIILVHGGGFMFGDQGMDVILPVIDKALENGYAVVSVDYRKATEAVFPGALADVKAAVRFVKAHAMDYGWDPEKITVWGESAGAYLSLMTALTPDVAELNGDVTDYDKISSDVQALVSFYAPVEFYTLYTEAGKPDSAASSFESKFLGTDITADKELTYTTYWETYADQIPTDMKAWIQAGSADAKVPHTQSVNFAERLAKYIGEENVEFSIIEGADHEDDLFYTDENLDAIFAWLDTIMK